MHQLAARAAPPTRRLTTRAAPALHANCGAFGDYWAVQFGSRWSALSSALAAPVEHVAFSNPWRPWSSSLAFHGSRWSKTPSKWRKVSHGGGAVFHMLREPSRGESAVCPAAATVSGLAAHFALDGASPLPALALDARPGSRCIDLCAAPGGKSLILAGELFGPPAAMVQPSSDAPPAPTTPTLLVTNDRSSTRRTRLRAALEGFLPAHLLGADLLSADGDGDAGGGSDVAGGDDAGLGPRSGVSVTGADAARWGGKEERWAGFFDRVLVDAPCSSERHFVHKLVGATPEQQQVLLGEWSASRLGRDAKQQYAILGNAARLLAAGGRLVYSTCSLDNAQNDGVVARLLSSKKHGAGLTLADPLERLSEPALAPLVKGVVRTEGGGAIALPDESRFGPLFWAVIERREKVVDPGVSIS